MSGLRWLLLGAAAGALIASFQAVHAAGALAVGECGATVLPMISRAARRQAGRL